MITVKIVCGCGQKYAFDVEPVNGRMPAPVNCPVCGSDGTAAANEIIARTLASQPARRSAEPAPPPVPSHGVPPNVLPPSSKSKGVLLWVCVVAVVLIAIGAAALFLVNSRQAAAEATALAPSRVAQQKPAPKAEPKVEAEIKDEGQEFSLDLTSSGAALSAQGTNSIPGKFFQWYRPRSVEFSTTKPVSFTGLPKGLHSPRYGIISLGPTNSPTRIGIVKDMAKDGSQRLFIDANGNGDFSDDPEVKWTVNVFRGRDPKTGAEIMRRGNYRGNAVVHVAYGSDTLDLGLLFYSFTEPNRSASLMYYRDYARTGKLKFGDKEHQIALSDDLCRGSFIPKPDEKYGSVSLYADLNDDGKFDFSFEGYRLEKPFNIGGTTYRLTALDDTGAKVRLMRSTETATEHKFLGRGEKALPFTAATIDGAQVHFPDDYKGKLVMLQFLTVQTNVGLSFTNTLATYKKYRNNGVTMLGVFTDMQAKEEAMRQFAVRNDLDCPLIYDGGYGESTIMRDYTATSSSVFLVDGDNGTVLGNNRRDGELGGYLATNLTTEIDRALATRKK